MRVHSPNDNLRLCHEGSDMSFLRLVVVLCLAGLVGCQSEASPPAILITSSQTAEGLKITSASSHNTIAYMHVLILKSPQEQPVWAGDVLEIAPKSTSPTHLVLPNTTSVAELRLPLRATVVFAVVTQRDCNSELTSYIARKHPQDISLQILLTYLQDQFAKECNLPWCLVSHWQLN